MVVIPDEETLAEYERRKATELYTEDELNKFLFHTDTAWDDVLEKLRQQESKYKASEWTKNDK